MKKLSIILSAFFFVLTLGLSAQDLNDAGEAYNDGISLTKENKVMKAIASYQECADICAELGEVGEGLKIKAETQISSLYLKLGIDAYKEKTFDTAISLFTLSSEYAKLIGNPDMAEKASGYISTTYAAKGNGLYRNKKYAKAIADFTKSLEYNPEYFKAYYGLAICFNKTEQSVEMEEAVKKVIELGGTDDVVEKSKTLAANYFLKVSGEAIQEKNYREASMMAKKCLEYNYQEANAHYYMALSNNNLGNWDEAIKATELGIKSDGDKSLLFFEQGSAYEGKGDITKACEAYGNVTSGPNVDAAIYQRTTVLNCN